MSHQASSDTSAARPSLWHRGKKSLLLAAGRPEPLASRRAGAVRPQQRREMTGRTWKEVFIFGIS